MRQGNRLQILCKGISDKDGLGPWERGGLSPHLLSPEEKELGAKNWAKNRNRRRLGALPALDSRDKGKKLYCTKNSFFRVTVPPTNQPTNQRSSFLHRPILLSSSSFSGLGPPREERGRRLKVGHGSGSFLLLCFPLLRRRMGGCYYHTTSHQPLSPSFSDPKKGSFFV